MSLAHKLIRFILLFSLTLYFIIMISMAVFLAATMLSRLSLASDYSQAFAKTKDAVFESVGVNKALLQLSDYAYSKASYHMGKEVVDSTLTVAYIFRNKQIIIPYSQHTLTLMPDNIKLMTIWRF